MTRRCSASSSSRRERARCHDQQPPRVQIPPQHGGESGPCSPCFTTDISSDPRYRCPSGKQPPRVRRSRSNEEKCESSSAEPAQSAGTRGPEARGGRHNQQGNRSEDRCKAEQHPYLSQSNHEQARNRQHREPRAVCDPQRPDQAITVGGEGAIAGAARWGQCPRRETHGTRS
jgi:hypothetical protein